MRPILDKAEVRWSKREKPAKKNQLPMSRVLDEPYIEASRLCAAETTLANDRQL